MFLKPIVCVFSLIACSVSIAAQKKDFYGVEIDDQTLTAKHLIPSIDSAMAAVQGSFLAYVTSRCMELKKKRDEDFPDGDPKKKMIEVTRKCFENSAVTNSENQENFSSLWLDILQQKADYDYCDKKIKQLEGSIEMMLEMPKGVISVALQIEENPADFTLSETNALATDTYSSFPIKCSSVCEWLYSSGAEFLRKQFKVYELWGIEYYANKAIEKFYPTLDLVHGFLAEMKADSAAPIDVETLRALVRNIQKRTLQEGFDFDDFCNALFVVEKFWFPMLDALRKIQKEALQAKDVDNTH